MSHCATPEQLEGFISGQLEGAVLEIITGHIEECTFCQQVLERITLLPGSSQRPDPGADDGPKVPRWLKLLKARGPRFAKLGQACDIPSPEGGMVDRPCETEETTTTSGSARIVPPLFPVFDGFRILREVGRGGMGVVYEAEETRLGRRVALKVLPAGLFPHPKQVERFQREARAAARLHHTNIVPVFGDGHQSGNHYYAMQYIEGRGIDTILRELRAFRERPPNELSLDHPSHLTDGDRLPFHDLARIGLQVALALDHAHEEGVLHRDIKPSNLLLDANGTAWVTDFGLAKTLEADDLTSTGDVVGTLRYMAPERFAGRCDARSDLYSLGLTLYELVALRPAFEALDRLELIERIRRESPMPIRKLDPRVPRDLETIINKLTAREPAERYGSAAELAADLRRFLEERPIKARPASATERALRWCRRNPWVAAFLMALSLGVIASAWQTFRATAAERVARRAEANTRDERNRAERSRDRALRAVSKLLEMGSEESRAAARRPGLFQPLMGNLRIVYATQCMNKAGYQEDDGEIPDLKALRKGERLWDAISRESPANQEARAFLVIIRRPIADLLAARGKDNEATEWLRLSLAPARGDADLCFKIAVDYAGRTGLVGLLPTNLTLPQLKARRQRLANHTFAMMREAALDGFHDSARVRNEPAFASVAANPEFVALVADLGFPVDAFARP